MDNLVISSLLDLMASWENSAVLGFRHYTANCIRRKIKRVGHHKEIKKETKIPSIGHFEILADDVECVRIVSSIEISSSTDLVH